MDQYLEQTFEIRVLKIGYLTNAGVLQIGVGAGKSRVPKVSSGYTTVGGSIVPLSPPPSVPLQAPVRDLTKGL